MFRNGEVTFYYNSWKIIVELYKIELNDIQEIHDQIFEKNYGKIDFGTFDDNDELWYANNSKALRVVRKNDNMKIILFRK